MNNFMPLLMVLVVGATLVESGIFWWRAWQGPIQSASRAVPVKESPPMLSVFDEDVLVRVLEGGTGEPGSPAQWGRNLQIKGLMIAGNRTAALISGVRHETL